MIYILNQRLILKMYTKKQSNFYMFINNMRHNFISAVEVVICDRPRKLVSLERVIKKYVNKDVIFLHTDEVVNHVIKNYQSNTHNVLYDFFIYCLHNNLHKVCFNIAYHVVNTKNKFLSDTLFKELINDINHYMFYSENTKQDLLSIFVTLSKNP